MKTIEFRVRPVTRYNLTRYESSPDSGSCQTVAEFGNWQNAHTVAQALQAAEAGAVYCQCPEPQNELTTTPAEMSNVEAAIKAEIERQRLFRESEGVGLV